MSIIKFIISGILFLISIVFFGWGIWDVLEERRMLSSYEPVQVRILEFEIQTNRNRIPLGISKGRWGGYRSHSSTTYTYSPVLSYRYTVNGRDYIGHQLTMLEETYWNRADLENLQQEYQVRNQYIGFYDPKDPTNSFLESNLTGTPWLKFGGAVLAFLLSVGLALYALFRMT